MDSKYSLSSLFGASNDNINLPMVLIFFGIFIFFIKFIKSGAARKNVKVPPGPWKLPVIGSLLHMQGALPHRALKDLARKHGDLMHLQLGEISSYVVSSARLAKEVMKTHDLTFATRPSVLATDILVYDNTDIAFAPYGDYWRQMRKIATLELLSAKKVRSFGSVREEEVWNLIESIRTTSSSTTRSSPPPMIDLTEMLFSLVNSIVCRSAFGHRYKDQDSLLESIEASLPLAGGFDVADLFPSLKLLHAMFGLKPKLQKLHRKTDQIIDNIINEHLNKQAKKNVNAGGGNDHEDLLDVLIRVKESGDLEFPITFDNIKAIIVDIFLAGTDTSSTTIEWAMAEMLRNPRVMEKAQAEMRQVLNGKQVIDESDIKELGYLKLVIKETLRLHPPAPLISRECREECEIDGYTIPKATKVIINVLAVGRDPEQWKDADSFYPERFENSSVDFTGSSYEFIPFGGGRRTCPGMTFGLANVELPLAQLLYHFDWKLPHGMNPGELDMTESFGLNVRRKNNLYVIATPHTT